MRKRHEAGGSSAGGKANGRAGGGGGATGVFGLLQQLDVYAKVDDDLAVRTETGAAVTIGFWVLMVILCIGEVQAYRKVQPPAERVVVDTTMGQKLLINADIVSVPTTALCRHSQHSSLVASRSTAVKAYIPPAWHDHPVYCCSVVNLSAL